MLQPRPRRPLGRGRALHPATHARSVSANASEDREGLGAVVDTVLVQRCRVVVARGERDYGDRVSPAACRHNRDERRRLDVGAVQERQLTADAQPADLGLEASCGGRTGSTCCSGAVKSSQDTVVGDARPCAGGSVEPPLACSTARRLGTRTVVRDFDGSRPPPRGGELGLEGIDVVAASRRDCLGGDPGPSPPGRAAAPRQLGSQQTTRVLPEIALLLHTAALWVVWSPPMLVCY